MSDTDLPGHWVTCPTSDVATLVRGVTYGKQDARKSEAKGFRPILRANNINGTINFDDLVFLPTHLISPAQQLRAGDILFAMSSGSRHLVGKSARINRDLDIGFGAFCGVLRPCDDVSDGYLFLVYQTRDFRRAVSEVSKGSNINNLKREHLLDYEIPLPPLAEQRRIVAKIEELFSELDAGEESLRRARRQLGVYRQSLLKQAFEGKLTAPWRKQNPHLLESPDELLKQIQTEREAHHKRQIRDWQVALEEWEGGDKAEKKPPKPQKLTPVSDSNLVLDCESPDSWASLNLSQFVLELGQGWSPKCENRAALETEWAVIKTTAIQIGHFDPSANKALPKNFPARPWLGLRSGEILITRAGPRSRCGIVCRVKGDHPRLMICDKAYRLVLSVSAASPEFVERLLCSPASAAAIEDLKTGINDSGVNLTQTAFLQLAFPIPPLPEQQEIVRLLDEQFTVIEQNEREIDAALKRSAALRQSILKKAFTGQLVPQDPTDEPASALLERIRKERSNNAAKPAKKRAPTKTRP